MAYSLKFEHPQFPDGTEFSVNGLTGLLVNGETLEIDEDAERMFIAQRGMSLEDAFPSKEGPATLSGGSSLSAEDLKSLLPPVVETEDANASNATVPTTGDSSDTGNETVTPPAEETEAVTENG